MTLTLKNDMLSRSRAVRQIPLECSLALESTQSFPHCSDRMPAHCCKGGEGLQLQLSIRQRSQRRASVIGRTRGNGSS